MPGADAAYARMLGRLAALARFGVQPGLERVAAVLAALGHPERRFPSLHIAGTNGKGSTAAIAEAMLRAAGARAGLYTSPHLLRFTERIRVGGEEIDRASAARAVDAALDAPGGDRLTFFEAVTAAAFLHFAEAGVDVAVVECGLGGRHDATSTCVPAGTVLTRVALDHAEVLGDTLEAIAAEKAGIARAGVPLLVGEVGAGPLRVIEAEAARVGAPLVRLGVDFGAALQGGEIDYHGPGGALRSARLGLAGPHQAENAALALAACALLPPPLRPDARARREGLSAVRWPARLERLAPDLRMDAAHNPDGAAALAAALGGQPPQVLLLGLLADKDADAVLAPLLRRAAALVCTEPPSPRALPAQALAERARALAPALPIAVEADPAVALAAARARAAAMKGGSEVVAAGSIYLVGHLRGLVLGEPADPVPVADPLGGGRGGR